MKTILFIIEPFQVEPLGLAYLAAAIKKAGHSSILCKYNDPDLNKIIEGIRPDYLGYSITTGKHNKFLDIHRELFRKYQIPSVWGGPHPTYFPEFIKEDGVDYIFRSESEQSFINFLNGERNESNVFGPVKLQPIDDIEPPDRDFLYSYPENYSNPIKNVMSSRGCPYSCPYCFNSAARKMHKGQKWVRYRSVSKVIEECISLKDYPLKSIYFEDDEFLANPNIVELMKAYKWKVCVPFHCQIRIELLTYKKARMLKEAGCSGVTFAIESGNNYIREKLLKRKMSKIEIFHGCSILHDVGIPFRTENMIGLPGETLPQMLETLDLNIKCKPNIAWSSVFQPYPSCPITEYCLQENLWDGNDAYSENFFDESILNTPLKNKIAKLQRLFMITCNKPWIRPWIKLLISLPLSKLYSKINIWWKKRKYKQLFGR